MPIDPPLGPPLGPPLDQAFSSAFLRGDGACDERPDADAGHPPGASRAASRPGASSAADGSSGVRYDAARHETPQRFALSPDFPRFAAEVRAALGQLRRLATAHPGEVDAEQISGSLTALEHGILDVNPQTGANPRFGDRADCLYGPAKDLLDALARCMADEAVPLSTRLQALSALAEDIHVCADGVLTHLNSCLRAVDRRHSGLLDSALSASENLMQDALLKAVRQEHGPILAQFPGDELHYLTGLQQALYPRLGRRPPQDRLAKPPSSALVNQALASLNTLHRPGVLAQAVAERARSSFETALSEGLGLPPASLHRPFDFDDAAQTVANAAAAALTPAYGELPLDLLLDWREQDGGFQARLHHSPTLLAHHLLSGLTSLGAVQPAGSAIASTASTRVATRPLAAVKPGLPAPVMRTLDGQLAWIEQNGRPRGLQIDDLAALFPALDAPPPLPVPFPGRPGHPPADEAGASRRLATLTALHNSWPDELDSFLPSFLMDRGIAEVLVQRMDDPALQRWLVRHGPSLDAGRQCWIQDALAEQGREALLSVEALQAWCPLTPGTTSTRLYLAAGPRASTAVLDRIAAVLLHVIGSGQTQAGQGPAATSEGPATHERMRRDAGLWLLTCFFSDRPPGEPPLARLLLERPDQPDAAGGMAQVLLGACERGVIQRAEALGVLAALRTDLVAPLGLRLCRSPSKAPLAAYLRLLDTVHARLPLTSDERADLFMTPAGLAQEDECALPPARWGDTPALLTAAFSDWLQRDLLSAETWMTLAMTPRAPQQAAGQRPGAAPHVLAAELTDSHPANLQAYLHAAASAYTGGKIQKAGLLALLLARKPEDGPGRTLPHQLAADRVDHPAMANHRLAAFLDCVNALVETRALDRSDLRYLLMGGQADDTIQWGSLARLDATGDHRYRQMAEAVQHWVEAGALTHHDEYALLGPDRSSHVGRGGAATADEAR